jgi:hypothetical protein
MPHDNPLYDHGVQMFFKYNDYIKFMHHMKNVGKIVPLGEWDFSNAIILRHDVDFDIEAAYQLALIEFDCGIRSTFFILTTCYTYNPCSAINREKLKKMADMGFEIGLHFDPTIYDGVCTKTLEQYVAKEADILTSISQKPVKSISLHNPSVHGQYPLFEGYCNAYSNRIFSDSCYLSDSRMDFRGKNPYEFVLNVTKHPVQLLLHPMHYSEEGYTYPDIFYQRLRAYINAIDQGYRINNSSYLKLMTTDLFTYIVKKREPL